MTGPLQPTIAHAFRRAALPLGWYYTVTLGLPLANGAAQSGAAFVNHAVVVVIVPPILIVLLCTIRQAAQAVAAARRDVVRVRHATQLANRVPRADPPECP